MVSQPFICPSFMAACWVATLCDIWGTLSGVTPEVTVLPSDSLTDAGMPPSGQRPGFCLHK